jgi:hypothetical protein
MEGLGLHIGTREGQDNGDYQNVTVPEHSMEPESEVSTARMPPIIPHHSVACSVARAYVVETNLGNKLRADWEVYQHRGFTCGDQPGSWKKADDYGKNCRALKRAATPKYLAVSVFERQLQVLQCPPQRLH